MRKVVGIVIVISSLLPGVLFAAIPASLKEAIDTKTRDLEKLNAQIKVVEGQLQTTNSQKNTLQKELKRITSSLSQLDLSIQASAITIDKLGLEVQSLDYDIKETESKIADTEEGVRHLIRDLWDAKRESLLLTVLRNKTLAETLTQRQSFVTINAALAEEVKDLKALHDTLSATLDTVSLKKSQIEQENKTLKHKRVIVLDTKVDKEVLLSSTKNQEKVFQEQLTALRKQQDDLNDQIALLETELRKTFDPSLLPARRPGVLASPVKNPIRTQDYGETDFARSHYRTKSHNGVDLAAPLGTPIYAADDGVVSGAANNGRLQYGKYIVIDHSNNLSTLYAHLSRQVVGKGDTVKRGDLIGYSGNTGYSFGAHLHFSVYWTQSLSFKSFPGAGLVPIGVTIDPDDYL